MTEYLNSVLIIDLYLSITNPFVPRESRLKFYYIVPVITLIGYIVLYFTEVVDLFGVTDHNTPIIIAYPLVFEIPTFICGCMVVYLLC